MLVQNVLRDQGEEKTSHPIRKSYHAVVIIFGFKEIILQLLLLQTNQQ